MKKLVLLFIVVLAGCIEQPGEHGTDAPIDAGIPDCIHIDTQDPPPTGCDACGVDQICVQRFDGTCGQIGVECQDRAAGCTGADCNSCDIPHCRPDPSGPITFTCQAAPCGTEIPGALHCYGP